MLWKTQILKSSRFDRRSPSFRHFVTSWLDELNERYLLHESVRKERASLARLSDGQLRDIGLHRAEAERESQRRYFDLPEDRD